MSPPPAPSARRLVVPLLLAALLGGGIAAVATAVLTGSDEGDTHTTTVIRQAPVAASGAGNNRANAANGLTAADIYARYAPGVVFVRAEVVEQTDNPFDFDSGTQRSEATGSGFVIDNAGDILTNNHVVDGARSVTVSFADKKSVRAKVIGSDPATDIALLKVDPEGLALRALPLGSSKDVHVGDPTIAIGNPFGLDRTLTTGVVSALQRQITAPNGFPIRDVIQTDAALNPGNSGGPLIDAAGRVIGINSQIETAGTSGSIGIGFAVPIDTVKSILVSLKKGEAVRRAYLGITSTTISKALDGLGLPADRGALVQSVTAGSPAEEAGIKAGSIQAQITGPNGVDPVLLGGDIIVKVDGKVIKSSDQLSELIAAHKPGDKVKLELAREGDDNKTLTVTLGTRPANLEQPG